MKALLCIRYHPPISPGTLGRHEFDRSQYAMPEPNIYSNANCGYQKVRVLLCFYIHIHTYSCTFIRLYNIIRCHSDARSWSSFGPLLMYVGRCVWLHMNQVSLLQMHLTGIIWLVVSSMLVFSLHTHEAKTDNTLFLLYLPNAASTQHPSYSHRSLSSSLYIIRSDCVLSGLCQCDKADVLLPVEIVDAVAEWRWFRLWQSVTNSWSRRNTSRWVVIKVSCGMLMPIELI